MTVNVPFTYISSLNLWFINHKFVAKDSSAFCLRNEKYYFMAYKSQILNVTRTKSYFLSLSSFRTFFNGGRGA